jgi:heptosyltransferase-2
MRNLDLPNIHKILVRSTNWIGDAVMATPAMGALRAAFPNAELAVVANPLVAELLSPHPFCDRIIVLDKRGAHGGLGGFLRFCVGLRKEGFDLAVLLQNAVEAAIMSFLAGIPRRAGYSTDGRGFLLTHPVPAGQHEKGLHHTRYYLHMLDRLGIRGGDGLLRLSCTAEEISWARKTLGAHGDGGWAAVNPGASYGSAKRWYPERFAAVADRLVAEFGFSVLLTGGPSETDLGRDIEKAMRSKPLNLIGKTSVREMMAALSQCRLAVTNDSGPMHVAAAFGVPTVALFGSTDHRTTSPLSSRFRIVRNAVECAPCLKRRCPTDHRCMEGISVEDVLEAVRSLADRPEQPAQ